MTLLRDDQILAKINAAIPVVTNLPHPPTLPAPAGGGAAPDPWYGKQSPVQAASLDLHVGKIYIPGTKKNKAGSVERPKTHHVLRTGHTVVVTSVETVSLPNNVAAVGFPPSRVAFGGLLMINPGHVDPGFSGQLRFTLINVGGEDIPLRENDLIFTVLLFELAGPATQDWLARRGGAAAGTPTREQIDSLSFDFLDVQSRAEKAAESAVNKAAFRAPIWTGILSTLVVLAMGLFTVWQPLQQVKKDVDGMSKILDIKEPQSKQVDDLKKKVEELEQLVKVPKKGP